MRDLHAAFTAAAVGRSGRDALTAMALAHRSYAHTHPGRYAATLRAPTADEQELRAVSDSLIQPLLAVLRGYGHEGDEAVHAARAVRSALHGFATLDAALRTGGAAA